MTDQERCDEYFVNTDRYFKEYAEIKQKVMNIMSENFLMNFFRLLWAMDDVNRKALISSLYMVLFDKENSYLTMWGSESEELHDIMREMVELVEGWFCGFEREEAYGDTTWTFIPL